MPIALIAAAVGAAGAIGGAVISSHAASNAANTAQNIADQNNALQRQTYEENKALEQPYITAGNTANDALQGFLGLGGDPAKTKAALDNYLNSTGYQFQLNQGLDAASQSKAAAGLYNSGATLKALDTYGTGLARGYGLDYANQLQTTAGRGASSANALAGYNQTSSTNQQNNNNSAGTTAANAGLANASNINGLIGNALSAYGTIRGASSFGTGGGGVNNAFGAAMSDPSFVAAAGW